MFHSTRRTSRAVLLVACASLLMLSGMAPRVLAQEAGTSAVQAAAKKNKVVVAYGITGNKKGATRLVEITTKESGRNLDFKADSVGKITGLQDNESILGIDFRPLNGQLYGLGSSSRLYTINTDTAVATAVGSQFVIPLSGTFFGFDFNPMVDRIRVVSDTNQNLRLNPITGGVVDSDANAANGTQGDGNLTYGDTTDPFIAGAAYTNPDNDAATGTTLYYIDSAQDTLVTSPLPNAGTLSTVGDLGVDVSVPLSFDIAAQNGVNFGIASFVTKENSKKVVVASIDLTTGAATFVGRVKSDDALTSFALVPNVSF